eukprot:Tamp_16799.p1 GENE.Tamp_16799~~Tamp_16799.p1  ORF type:complete len:159 (-),score=17.13 Tamp_16799:547-1023(-)
MYPAFKKWRVAKEHPLYSDPSALQPVPSPAHKKTRRASDMELERKILQRRAEQTAASARGLEALAARFCPPVGKEKAGGGVRGGRGGRRAAPARLTPLGRSSVGKSQKASLSARMSGGRYSRAAGRGKEEERRPGARVGSGGDAGARRQTLRSSRRAA